MVRDSLIVSNATAEREGRCMRRMRLMTVWFWPMRKRRLKPHGLRIGGRWAKRKNVSGRN